MGRGEWGLLSVAVRKSSSDSEPVEPEPFNVFLKILLNEDEQWERCTVSTSITLVFNCQSSKPCLFTPPTPPPCVAFQRLFLGSLQKWRRVQSKDIDLGTPPCPRRAAPSCSPSLCLPVGHSRLGHTSLSPEVCAASSVLSDS